MKLSCVENQVPGNSLQEKVYNLEKFGYQGIELGGRRVSGKLKEIKEVFSKSSIKISAILGQLSVPLLSATPEERNKAVEEVKERLSSAAEVEAPGVIVVPIFGPPRLPDLSPLMNVQDLETKLLIPLLEDIVKFAEKLKTIVFLEPLNRYETHFLNRLKQAMQICQQINSPCLKILADTFHMNIEEEDITKSITASKSFIGHIHLADSNRLIPGYGHLDFKPILKTLKDMNYAGYYTLECFIYKNSTEELPKAVKFLNTLYNDFGRI